MLNSMRRAAVVFDRVLHDHEALLTQMQMTSLFAEIGMPDGITGIGENAFSGCTNMTSVTIPDSITNIAEYAFFGCTSLSSIAIPDGVTSIGNYTFARCNSLATASIGNGISSIGDWAFVYCYNLTATNVAEANLNFTSKNGVLFNKSMTTLIQCPDGKEGHYIIPDGVTEIGNSAFEDCTKLTSISIPDSVTSIGSLAFAYCDSLITIDIAEANQTFASQAGVLFSKDRATLMVCPGGKEGSYIIPNYIGNINDDAFYRCTKLTSVIISGSVSSIGRYAFASCTSLTSVTVPASISSIACDAFANCTSLQKVYVVGNTTRTIRRAFDGTNVVFYERPEDERESP